MSESIIITVLFDSDTALQQNEYDIYAKWTAHANRASNTPYIIKHALGETTINVNQQQNGGQYHLLGTFTLDNLSTMTITDNADGYVIADGIQLIPTGTNTSTITESGLYYIHTDHLDTPKFLTDNNQNKVWQSNKTPFGLTSVNEDVDGNGQPIVLNFRFPGQYYDSETNLYYNYFRYYDPSIGRYITSDPIGLKGGINTYAYVAGNPLIYADFLGLRPLTLGEQNIINDLFGGQVDLGSVEIENKPHNFLQGDDEVVTSNGTIWFPPNNPWYSDDFSQEGINSQGLFLHEMAHIWQEQQGSILWWEKLNAGNGEKDYQYDLCSNKKYNDYNIEQQANLWMDFFFQKNKYKTDNFWSQSKDGYLPDDYSNILRSGR